MQGPLTASAMGGLELGGPTERRWLKSQGYHVVVNRVGTAPLDQCTIRAVRPGPKVLAHRLGSSRLHNDVITTVTNNTVYVDVAR